MFISILFSLISSIFKIKKPPGITIGLVISPFLVYTGITYNLPPIFRVGLVAGGTILGINELKYYMINRKAQKIA